MPDDTRTPNPASQVVSQLRGLWDRQPPRRRTLAVVALAAVAGLVLWVTLIRRPPAWSVVSDSASADDTQELAAVLRGRGIPVRIQGGKVEVPVDRLADGQAAAAAAGLPRAGKGFELFDGSSFGKSSFTEQINYRRALEGELARSITTLAKVDGARVHLALGRRSVFKEREEPPSASIALRLFPGQSLTTEQVRGIRQLVAASIDGMKPDAVAVVDNHGNLLDGADGGSRDRKAEIERTVTMRVRTMIERVVGAGRVSVVATADVDDRQVSETQEVFDHEHPVVRSESRSVDGVDPAQGIGGVAGTRANLPGAPAAGAVPGAGSAGGRLQETKNYEVSRTVRQTTKPDAQLQRLHVAVVVDYKDGEDGERVARSDDELAQLIAIARQAAAIDDARGDKIELRSMEFAPVADDIASSAAPATSGIPLVPIGIGAGGAVVLLLLAAAVLRKKRRPASDERHAPVLALPAPVAELERALSRAALALPHPESPEPPALPEGRSVRDRVIETVRGDLDRTASVLSGWLATSAPAKAPATPAKENRS